MKYLRGRKWDIAAGRTDLEQYKVDAYRERWAREGYHVPPMHGKPEPITIGLGDVVAFVIWVSGAEWIHRKVTGEGCKCAFRRAWLNSIVYARIPRWKWLHAILIRRDTKSQ